MAFNHSLSKEEIINVLKNLKPILYENFGIEEIALFGSFSREEASSDSDIDILVIKMKEKNGLILAKAKRFLSDYFGREVDIGLYDSLRPYIKHKILKDLINV
ncbi:MAG: nucleotidyltransferase family protein [Hydrogenothermaceae bacterium]